MGYNTDTAPSQKHTGLFLCSCKTVFNAFSILLLFLAVSSGCAAAEGAVYTDLPADRNLADSGTGEAMEKAIEAYYSGSPEKAVLLFKEISEKYPESRKPLLSMARILSEAGRYSEIEDIFLRLEKTGNFYSSGNDRSGSLWEDPYLHLFLAGKPGQYLEKTELSVKTLQALTDSEKKGLFSEMLSEIFFFRGWAFADSGRDMEAVAEFRKAINERGYFPAAYLMLGSTYYRMGSYAEAEKMTAEALRHDSNLTQGRPLLAKAIIAQGRIDEGYSALKRALSIRPWDIKTAEMLSEFEKSYPHIIEAKEEKDRRRRETTRAAEAETFTKMPETMPEVRVGLAESLHELHIKPGGFFRVTDSSGNIVMTGEKERIIKIMFKNGKAGLYNESGTLVLEFESRFDISAGNPKDTIILFDVSHSTG